MAQVDSAKKIWVTLSGLPLTITLEWPFHRSTSGADFWVLHGDIRLENSDGLHAPVAVNLSAVVREVVASLEPGDVEAPVINALRKEVDHRQIEFVKSGKLKPVAFSSRHYDFKRGKWVFGRAGDEEIATFLERTVYWGTKLSTGGDEASVQGCGDGSETKIPRVARNEKAVERKVWIGDPTEAQYLETTAEHALEIARRLAGDGLVRMEGEWAVGTDKLMEQAERFEGAMRSAVERLEKKHAFERG